MNDLTMILAAGSVLCAMMVGLGVALRYFHAYGLVAGYNRATPEERAKYDIAGLAEHLGDGLITLGALCLAAAVTLVKDYSGLFALSLGLFVFIAIVIVIGGQKYTPGSASIDPDAPTSLPQRFLKRVLPTGAFSAIEKGTRQWVIECRCGSVRDLWDAGGIRYKGAGEPRQYGLCPACDNGSLLKVRRKSPVDR
jgi:hypothetical protein